MNVLMSYHYWARRPLEDELHRLFGDDPTRWPNLMIDSGAYSAREQGASIDIYDYATWLRTNPFYDYAINLDVIYDAEQSRTNWDILHDAGIETLPVFHGGEPLSFLEELCERFDYVCLGGMASSTGNAAPWIVQCMKVAEKYGTTFHGLGQTSWGLMRDFPWQSVDSSSWTAGQRFGQGHYWDGRNLRTFDMRDPATIAKAHRSIRKLGFDPHLFTDRSLYHYRWMSGLSGVSWLTAEAALQHTRPDFRLYLADVTPWSFNYLWQAVETIAATGTADIGMRSSKE